MSHNNVQVIIDRQAMHTFIDEFADDAKVLIIATDAELRTLSFASRGDVSTPEMVYLAEALKNSIFNLSEPCNDPNCPTCREVDTDQP